MSYRDAILADSPVGYWRLGEANGTTAVDETDTVDGVYTDGGGETRGYTLGQTGALSGDSDTAVLFNPTLEGFVAVENNAAWNVGSGPFSLEAWIKCNSTGSVRSVIGKDFDAFWLYVGSDNKLTLSKSSGGDIVKSTITITDTNWHHVVAVYQQGTSTAKLYIDGVDRSDTVTLQTLTDNLAKLGLGSRYGNYTGALQWRGTLDEVAIYNVVLNVGQVLAHYSAGFDAVALGSNVAGSSGSFLNATLSNVAVFDRPLTAADVALLYDSGPIVPGEGHPLIWSYGDWQ